MNPTLYDILGVSRDSSREEIRAAWRAAADRFEPGQGGATKQFRLFNEAAEVLLDPERRAEYDAGLADPSPSTSPGRPGLPPADDRPAAPAGRTGAAFSGATVVRPLAGRLAGWRERRQRDGSAASASRPAGGAGSPSETAGALRRLPWLLLVPLVVVTALVIGVAAYLTIEANRAEAYERALDRAPAAAENAAIAVLAYDHESLEADRDAAAKFLTPDYRSDYVETFDALVIDNATETETVVEVEVLASSAMAVTEERDPESVNVLLFVNQTTTSTTTGGDPSVALNRVRFEMVEVDGTWLVDDITSY